MVAYHLPAEVLGESVELFLDVFSGELALVDTDEPPLEECLGEFHISLLEQIVACVSCEAVFAFAGIFVLEQVLHLGVEGSLVLYDILTEDAVEGLRFGFGCNEGLHVLHCHLPHRIHVFQFVLLHVEHGGAV